MPSLRTLYCVSSAAKPILRRQAFLTAHRWKSSLVVKDEVQGLNVSPNQPDYSIHPDRSTSTFTPVPKRIQDGSEEIPVSAAIASGAPMELQARKVRIYRETKPATQSGDWKSHHWRMDWDVLGKGHRWENQLIGWQSSGDAMQGTRINFSSKEDAIRFAEKQGYEYFVQEPQQRRIIPKAYADNFIYSPGKLKHIRTK